MNTPASTSSSSTKVHTHTPSHSHASLSSTPTMSSSSDKENTSSNQRRQRKQSHPQRHPAYTHHDRTKQNQLYFPLFSREQQRYYHFTNSSVAFCKPLPMRIYTFQEIMASDIDLLTSHAFGVILKPEEIPIYVHQLMVFEKILGAVILNMDIDMFISAIRNENVFLISQWCMKRNIQLGCYIVQRDEHMYVPEPIYCKSRIYAFAFHILDTCCSDKHTSICDMICYLLRLGIPSHTIAPLYIPMAPSPLQHNNLLGYFFRDDLCKHHVERTNQKLHDIAFS